MEAKLQFSPKISYSDEIDDVKYVSKLSTILVATIEEAKDRISQIEYIFCTQLYSNFQSKSKSLQKVYIEAKKEAEDSWKTKEKDLLVKIEKLELQNQEALEENRCLKLEKEKALQDLDEKIKPLLTKEMNQQERIDRLEDEIRKKSKEVVEGLELHNRLLQLVQSNSFAIVEKAKQLKDQEEKTNEMIAQVKKLEQKIEELEAEVREKTKNVVDKEELTKELLTKIETLTSASTKAEESLNQQENEKKELVGKLEVLECNVCELEKKNRKKCEENEEAKVLQEQLLQQIEVKNMEIFKQKLQLEQAWKSNVTLEEKLNGNLRTMPLQIELKDEIFSLADLQNPETAPAEQVIKKLKIKNEVSVGEEDAKCIPMSSFRSPTSEHKAPRCPPTSKSVPIIGTKRPSSRWVDTRTHRSRDGPDPHDEFLNTPLENLRVTVNKAMNDSSDDETQDMSVENQPMQLAMPVRKEFKYVESVRKKAEREKLKGVECKQCKKFYDAVLPNGGDEKKQNLRCEHHDGVSRHRYKYVPPLTPDGFWNIGFESEM